MVSSSTLLPTRFLTLLSHSLPLSVHLSLSGRGSVLSYFCCQFLHRLSLSTPSHSHMPSSIVTFRHHGTDPVPLSFGCKLSSTSPTCLLSLTSRTALPPVEEGSGLSRLARDAMLRFIDLRDVDVNPWDELFCLGVRDANVWSPMLGWNHSSLMTGRCHCRGSEEDERRLRWR